MCHWYARRCEGLVFMQDKKRILVVATGGTIASVEDGRGLTPGLSGDELLAYVPEAANLCHIDVV